MQKKYPVSFYKMNDNIKRMNTSLLISRLGCTNKAMYLKIPIYTIGTQYVFFLLSKPFLLSDNNIIQPESAKCSNPKLFYSKILCMTRYCQNRKRGLLPPLFQKQGSISISFHLFILTCIKETFLSHFTGSFLSSSEKSTAVFTSAKCE